ncbi:MAG: carboxypeptidase-like regulatory domain-containing protein [Myxococcales bacterium]|nr:carboxypeptidase-like regulatory domain-containing protein [Myxococcales bacterium]
MRSRRCQTAFTGALAALLALLVGCGSSSTNKQPPAPQITGVMGKVTDQRGEPLAGVTVSGGGATTTTDAQGKFILSAPAGPSTVVTLSKVGYLPNQKRVDVQDGTATAIKVRLMTEEPKQSLDADQGGTVTTGTGATLIAGPGVLVDPDGNPVTGTVDVHLTTFDVSDSNTLDTIPNFVALEGTDEVMLQSMGLIDVTLRQNGNVLQVKDGATVTIRLPVASNVSDPPATIDLWSFDDATGRWVNEGTATLSPDKTTYEATISHFSRWNCDQVYTTTCIRGVVKVSTGDVLPGAFVTGTGINYNGTSQTTADENGKFCLPVRLKSQVLVTAIHPEGGGAQKEVETPDVPLSLPEACLKEQCKDTGEYVIQIGTLTGPNGDVDCSKLSLPLAGTCAASLIEAFQCWQPVGKCHITTGGITWDNGSKLVTSTDGTTSLRSGSDELCATMSLVDSDHVKYEIPNGPSYVVQFGSDTNSDTVIVCPDGSKVTLSAADQAAFEACSGNPKSSSSVCENDIASGCKSTSECSGALICCNFPQQGISVCLPATACPN